MSYKSAVIKLFFIIMVFLSVLIGLILYAQNRYFDKYYIQQKKDGFEALSAQLAMQLDGRQISEDNMVAELRKIEDRFYIHTILVKEKETSIANDDPFAGYDMFSVIDSMPVEAASIVQRMAISAFSDGLGYDQIQDFKENGFAYIATVNAVQINGEEYALGMAASLQPVDEANAALSEVSWLAYAAAVMASLGLSFIIALLVARPLVKEVERRKALDNMRRDFIANASHEMKTPISIISGYTERMKDKVLSQEKYTEYSHIIHDETDKLGKLVKDMLEIALLQNEKYEPRKAEVKLSSLLAETLSRFANQIEEKNIRIIREQAEPVSAVVDKQMMETVFSNFISNAISHTPPNGYIRIKLVKEHKRISFEIENEGDPIPEDALPHIWESFYRVDKSHNREAGRFGLGLHTVNTIIDKHNGKVGVDNKEKSVRFYFDIPQ